MSSFFVFLIGEATHFGTKLPGKLAKIVQRFLKSHCIDNTLIIEHEKIKVHKVQSLKDLESGTFTGQIAI